MSIKLLISPLAQRAYFADYEKVAMAELLAHLPDAAPRIEKLGTLSFLCLDAQDTDLQLLSRLSFVQGIFSADGDKLAVIDQDPGFILPEELVHGAKYQGKTNETVTQLAINIGLRFARTKSAEPVQLLDPMAGRGTTLFWGLRYGMNGWGIELNRENLPAFHQHVKKQSKLHRLRHNMVEGFIGKKNKQDLGRFCHVDFGEQSLRLVCGDSSEAEQWLQNRKFHLLVADLPYGIQHLADGKQRNPAQLIEQCAPSWAACLRKGAAMVLIFNEYLPGRDRLETLFKAQGLQVCDFRAPHRMSESIVRDLLVFTKP